MPAINYKIELDFFSGVQNPSLEITMEDFKTLYREVISLEKSVSSNLFDGLGFRGFIVTTTNSTSIYIQNKIIKIETVNDIQYFKSNHDIVLKVIKLFKSYDRENNFNALIKKTMDEYL